MSDELIWVKLENGTAEYPPENNKREGDILKVNYWLVPSHLEEAGFEQKTQAEIDSYIANFEASRTEAFRSACAAFRAVCAQIKAYFGFSAFRGGFDEMELLASNEKYLTLQGLSLAQAWSAANSLCTYEAQKIGINQPDWWYQCWADAAAADDDDDDDDGNDENSGGADDDEA